MPPGTQGPNPNANAPVAHQHFADFFDMVDSWELTPEQRRGVDAWRGMRTSFNNIAKAVAEEYPPELE